MTDILNHTYAVIMAGGGGTRLWPLSRRDRPKQMLPLLDEKRTLFQTTVERLEGLLSPDRIYVVTVAAQVDELRAQTPEIPARNFIVEPEPRGTASVVGLAAAILRQRDPEAAMAVLPADHYIRNRDLFHLLIRVAVDVAEKGYLVTLGVTPTYAATGYGYIQRGETISERVVYPVYRVLKFKEKPNEVEARAMIASGDHSWNSGMFVWRADSILAEVGRQLPRLNQALTEIASASTSAGRERVIQRVWRKLDTVTVDYGVMENADKVAVLPAGGLEWSDVGSWDSLFDVHITDKDGNIVFANQHIAEDTHHSLVYDNGGERLIVTIGVDDLVVVDTRDVLLVCHKDHAQKVRKVVDSLKNSEHEKYL
ncbi:MAG: mannose-1-phosphate guanyltransferase [Anaerolineae bacterium CFX3]|nr:mannose-1-phosphate guanyltransferase [Anaerolineae bacterium CFX3]MCQ3946329.1 mannose-1-phosphate guanyltransferase [Anaerolineae bacterium]RIK27713.1 MAG: mannose-1-phosphate guanyltransferase [Anaerolineae bacterium]